MARPPSPLDYLQSREHFQKCKYRLQRTEAALLSALECKTVSELETAILQERTKQNSPHLAVIKQYFTEHQDLDAADALLSAATDLQRRRIEAADAAKREMAHTFAGMDC